MGTYGWLWLEFNGTRHDWYIVVLDTADRGPRFAGKEFVEKWRQMQSACRKINHSTFSRNATPAAK